MLRSLTSCICNGRLNKTSFIQTLHNELPSCRGDQQVDTSWNRYLSWNSGKSFVVVYFTLIMIFNLYLRPMQTEVGVIFRMQTYSDWFIYIVLIFGPINKIYVGVYIWCSPILDSDKTDKHLGILSNEKRKWVSINNVRVNIIHIMSVQWRQFLIAYVHWWIYVLCIKTFMLVLG